MSHSSFPVDRNVGAMPLPALHSDPSICNIPCRSFSSATYQPVYPQHYNATLCYPPVPQNVCQHVSQRLRSMELRNNVDIPDISEVDDDDVFVPSGTRILPNPGVVLPLPTAIPCSPTTLQMMQSRKRAHSAGDMVGLYSPTVARLLYPNTGHTAIPSQNFNPPTVNGSHSFAHNGPSGPTLPRKWLITDQPTPSKFDQIYQPPVNITKSNSIVTPTNPRLSNGIINIKPQIAPNSTNRSMPVSDPRKSAAVRNHSSIKEPGKFFNLDILRSFAITSETQWVALVIFVQVALCSLCIHSSLCHRALYIWCILLAKWYASYCADNIFDVDD